VCQLMPSRGTWRSAVLAMSCNVRTSCLHKLSPKKLDMQLEDVASRPRCGSNILLCRYVQRPEPYVCLAAACANCSCCNLSSSSIVMPLESNLFNFFSRPCTESASTRRIPGQDPANLLDLLMLRRSLQHGRDVVSKAQLFQRFRDVVAGDGLLGLLLRDVIGLR
jgi:hypothetical protein